MRRLNDIIIHLDYEDEYKDGKVEVNIFASEPEELVRCKDCKYNGIWCDIQDIEWTEKGKPIEFCSYGERKEE